MSEPCLELMVFKVRNKDAARRARLLAQDIARHYEGFVAWTAYESIEDEGLFADLVFWQCERSARSAADRLRRDPTFASILAEIDGILTVSRFAAGRTIEAAHKAA